MTPAQLRSQARVLRNALAIEEREHLSFELCKRLRKKLEEVSWLKKILLFYPLGSEVSLLPLAEDLLKDGYEIYFPVTLKEGIRFYRVTSLSDFVEGRFHVMEPVSREECYENGNAVSLTPGLAFTMKGSRIGYGGGYYDRFLKSHPWVFSIGVCFDQQLLPEIPQEEWDVSMDAICTPSQYQIVKEV